jgi:hypothetical protein
MAEGNALSRAREGRGTLSGFYCEVSVILIDINASSDSEWQPEQSFSCPVDVSEVSGATWRAGTDAQELI